jgi:hypothetical protein
MASVVSRRQSEHNLVIVKDAGFDWSAIDPAPRTQGELRGQKVNFMQTFGYAE